MLSKRENYMRVLHGERGEFLPFVPNFDHWLNVNRTCGSLPSRYRDMSRNDIVRDVGGTIWARTTCLRTTIDPSVRIESIKSDGQILTIFRTPVGTVQTVHRYADDMTRAFFLKEHRIKGVEDIPVVKYIIENTHYELAPEAFLQSEREVGDDGISLVMLGVCCPYIEFGKKDAGWERGIYLFHDHTAEVESLMEVYASKAEEAATLLAQSPAVVIATGDNMDEWTTPPNVFRKYAIPFYRRIAAILHPAGKILEGHWCGRTRHLLPFVKECGINVVEAPAVAPMADLTVPEALDLVGESVVIQGGIPSTLLCPQGGTRENYCNYIKQLVKQVPHGYRFALGMSDNVPPDADFDRVRLTAEIVGS